MKYISKYLSALCFILLMTGCGVGSYSISSGKEDTSFISFTSQKEEILIVEIDNTEYQVESVKTSAYKTNRNIRQTARNSIRLVPGKHSVKVYGNADTVVFEKIIILSASEHRVIEL